MSGRGRGRGAYFRAKYGGGDRGQKRSAGDDGVTGTDDHATGASFDAPGGTKDWTGLENVLRNIDGQQYGAYKRLLGRYHHASPDFTLSIDRVQADAYAPPSTVRAIVPWKETGLPDEYLQSDIRRIAVSDFVTRVCASLIRSKHLDRNIVGGKGGWSGPKGGAFNINAPGQEVLPRTSAMIDGNKTIELRFTTSLPAAGRTVLGQQAGQILAVNLVELVKQSLLHANLDQAKLKQHVAYAESQSGLREQLAANNLISFIANGAILPRASGASATPMKSTDTIPFQSPKDLEITLTLPDSTNVFGMGIPYGITLLTGGGFHGKSTLLEAIQLGIYNHIPGDGREQVVTDPTAVKIRAEDGRSVTEVDISPFISNLPGGKSTKRFSTDDASGSTSMAANIQEALESGCKTLLIDEDSSATNLLVRGQRMQSLIRHEPITPLVAKARALFDQHGVSTVIVIGGLDDWLSVADRVIAMESYVPRAVTAEAKAVIQQFPSIVAQDAEYGSLPARKFQVDLSGSRTPSASRKGFISIKPQAKPAVEDPSEAEPGVDVSGIDQLVETGQSRMIGTLMPEGLREDDIVGIDRCLPVSLIRGDLVAVRRLEFAAALSRLRGVAISH
ncbi:hypothetical protein LTR85_001682 [Meristemomyces frigidus]|nr:hypothetical protein LTR85_001682 [Meristemomyces frigidus]